MVIKLFDENEEPDQRPSTIRDTIPFHPAEAHGAQMDVKLPNMDLRDKQGRIIIQQNRDEDKFKFFERVHKTLDGQSTEGIAEWPARGWFIVPANPSAEDVSRAFSEAAEKQWTTPRAFARDVPLHYLEDARLGTHGKPHGDEFYKDELIDGEEKTLIRTFIRQEAETSPDLFQAAQRSGGSLVDRFKDLHSSSIHRISEALVAAYEVPDYKQELALSALVDSGVLSKRAPQESNAASYGLNAARKLLATSVATGSIEEVRDAKIVLQAQYTTAWKIPKITAGERATEDLQQIIDKINELQRNPAQWQQPGLNRLIGPPSGPTGPAAG